MTGARNAQFNLAGVNDASPLGSIVAPGANLRATGSSSLLGSSLLHGSLNTAAAQTATATPPAGTLNLAGVRSISLRTINSGHIILGALGVASTSLIVSGTVTDTQLMSTVPISTLKAKAWVKSAIDIQLVSAPSIANLQITGEFDPDLTLNRVGRVAALGNARIGGAVSVGNWSITGNAHSIYLGAVAPSWGGVGVSGSLFSLVVANGGMTSDVTAGSIYSLRVAGALSSNITTSGNLTSLVAGQLIGGYIDVGSTATSIADATLANLGVGHLGSVRLTSRAANTFSDSSIVADVIGSVVTGQINAVGTTEGIAGHTIHSATLTLDHGAFRLPASALTSNAALSSYLSTKGLTLGNFMIDIL